MNTRLTERRRPALREDRLDLTDFVGESFLFLGAGSTVLLQLASPGVGHGVADHSTTLIRPLDRLRTTMTYVYAVTLGTPEEKRAIVRLVNKTHVPVRADTYNAFDPELQLWVAATLYKNGSDLYERFYGKLDDETAERIYQQSAVYGTALQVDESAWPESREAFDKYWETTIEHTEVDDQVRSYVHALLGGGDVPFVARVLLPLNRFVTIGLLPQTMREKFELPWDPRDQRRFDALMRLLPLVYKLVPKPIRWAPAHLYLLDMRRRLRNHRHVI